jgi:hypothetical protein
MSSPDDELARIEQEIAQLEARAKILRSYKRTLPEEELESLKSELLQPLGVVDELLKWLPIEFKKKLDALLEKLGYEPDMNFGEWLAGKGEFATQFKDMQLEIDTFIEKLSRLATGPGQDIEKQVDRLILQLRGLYPVNEHNDFIHEKDHERKT